MRLIITCGCGDTTQFAKDAFKILHPDEETPEVVELSKETRPLIRIFLLTVTPKDEADKILDTKFALAIHVRYEMRFDVMTGESDEGAGISVIDLIKGEPLNI